MAALWLSLIFWTYRDIRSRTEDRFIQILAALVTAILGPFGILIYLLLRPQYTIDQKYQHTLEEEALLTEIEEQPLCPGCGGRTERNWLVCPSCHTHLGKACENCSNMLQLNWQICPYCATPVRSESELYESPA